FLDGWDHYTPSDSAVASVKWTLTGGGGGGSWTTAAGRIAGNCFVLTRGSSAGNGTVQAYHPLTQTPSTLIWGVAYKFANISVFTDITSVDDNVTGTNQVTIRMSTGGSIRVLRNGTQIGSDSAPCLFLNTWQYIETKVVVASGTSGSVGVWVDGVQVQNITGVNTQGSTGTNANKIYVGDRSGNWVLALLNSMTIAISAILHRD